jgi:hypothetical protein
MSSCDFCDARSLGGCACGLGAPRLWCVFLPLADKPIATAASLGDIPAPVRGMGAVWPSPLYDDDFWSGVSADV